ncbi:MAG: glycosyltransferase [Actinomycetota bacterium]
MRIALFADFNSSFARDWAQTIAAAGHEIRPFSSTQADTDLPDLELPQVWPTRIRSRLAGRGRTGGHVSDRPSRARFAGVELASFASTCAAARALRPAVERFRPDVVHSLRLPFETIAMHLVGLGTPLVGSVWGNDFTLHAEHSKAVGYLTRRTLAALDGLHADAERDLRLALGNGLRDDVPTLFVPTSGGVPTDELLLDLPKAEAKRRLGVAADTTLVVNPRGLRSYIDTESFPRAGFALGSETMWFVDVAVGQREGWSHNEQELHLSSSLTTTGRLNRSELFLLFRACDIVVSPSYHDGLPNSIAEAMGSGAAPILSDIESTEHLISRSNGMVFDVAARGGAGDLVSVLERFDRAANYELLARTNQDFVADAFSRAAVVDAVDDWYHRVVERAPAATIA